MTVLLRFRHAIEVNDVAAVARLAKEHPDWPSLPRTSLDPDPLTLALTTHNRASDGAIRQRLVDALLAPLAPGALHGMPHGLHEAVRNGWDDLVERLLPFSDPDEPVQGKIALITAINRLDVPVLRRLLPHADPNRRDGLGLTPLMVLSRLPPSGSADLNERTHAMYDALLSDPRLDPNLTTDGGLTALALACRYSSNDHRFVRTLLEKGVDPNVPDATGATPFMYILRTAARLPNNRDLLDWWLAFDAQPQAVTGDGPTPDAPHVARPRLNLLLRGPDGRGVAELARSLPAPQAYELWRRVQQQEAEALRDASGPDPAADRPARARL